MNSDLGRAGRRLLTSAALILIGSSCFATPDDWHQRFERIHHQTPAGMSDGFDAAAAAEFATMVHELNAAGDVDRAYRHLLQETVRVAPRVGLWTLPIEELPILSLHVGDLDRFDARAHLETAIEIEAQLRTLQSKPPVGSAVLHASLNWVLWPRFEVIYTDGRREFLDLVPTTEPSPLGDLKRAAVVLYLEIYQRAVGITERFYHLADKTHSLAEFDTLVASVQEGPGLETMRRLARALGTPGCQADLEGSPPLARRPKPKLN